MKNKTSLKGTQTEKNLLAAFSEEATSLVKYRLFAKKSKYQVIEEKFLDIADQEEEHAEVFLELLNALGKDKDNLKNSIALEGFVSSVDYPQSAEVAREEGFCEIADVFEKISTIEERHKKTFELYQKQLMEDSLIKKNTRAKWVCLKCGFIYDGLEPPEECPVCEHSRRHFKIYSEGD